MEAILASQTLDREGRHMKTPKRIPSHGNHHRSFDLRPSNGAAPGVVGGGAGLLFGLARTDPYSILYSNIGDLGCQLQPPPPPLLPLPPLPLSKSYNSNIKALSYPPPTNSKSTRKPKQSSLSSSSLVSSPLTPKKSSPRSKPHPKKDQKINSPKQAAKPSSDPAELPREGLKGNLNSGHHQAAVSDVELSGPSIFILAPPPSSLPLPSFTLRPKLSCKAEVVAASAISAKSNAFHEVGPNGFSSFQVSR